SIKPQIIKLEEIKPLQIPEIESHRWFPSDIRIRPSGSQGFCPSMGIDGNDLYCALLCPAGGSFPYQYIRIYKSTDFGATWSSWMAFYSSASAYNIPSLAVTHDNIVVAFVRSSYGNIGVYWRKKDGSNSGWATIDGGTHPSLNKWSDANYNPNAAYLKNGDVMFASTSDQGASWNTPEVVASGSYDIKFDGAITTAYANSSTRYYVVCYFDGSYTYVSRGRNGTWSQVFQISVPYEYPSIRGLQYSSYHTVLLMYGDWYHSGQRDLAFAFSYDYGEPGTWQAHYWNEPSYDQLWPIVGNPNTIYSDWFTIAAWGYNYPTENMVINIRHYYNDIVGNYEWHWSSANCTPPYLYSDEGKIGLAYRASDGMGYTAFEDRRDGYLNTYFNWGDDPGVEESTYSKRTPFYLKQNHPNPVSSMTVIKYALPKSYEVEMKIFDVSGKEIGVILNEHQEAGSYKVNWDIRNITERLLPNGVYFYRLKTGDFTETKKMVVVR
ncbi:T9SS type A sorting domain-containing protein, partial [candidate division WOR-3 bacterium]|nr:T9SS type A sorting domain-containing protein [candidate division WOR-3 bacterium]